MDHGKTFIATDRYAPHVAIYGIGPSPDAAIQDGRTYLGQQDQQFAVFEADPALAENLRQQGKGFDCEPWTIRDNVATLAKA